MREVFLLSEEKGNEVTVGVEGKRRTGEELIQLGVQQVEIKELEIEVLAELTEDHPVGMQEALLGQDLLSADKNLKEGHPEIEVKVEA